MMEYGDFLYIGADGLSFIKEAVDFLDYLTWLSTDKFKPLEEQLIVAFNQKERLPARSTADDIIAGMVVTSENDFNRKTSSNNYYICNAHAILVVVRHIFTPEFINILSFYNKRPETQFLVRNYQDILLWLLRDVEDLSSLYSQEMLGVTKYRSFIRNRYVHTASLYQVFRQGLFGSVSSHSFVDKEPSANIATIRQLIELRLRRGFGAMVFQDTLKHNAIEPLDMSILFSTLRKYSDDIEIDGIKLESLNRIYTWSNSFIHSGLGDYSWIPFYLEIVLRGAFFGHRTKTGWNINNGISTTVSVIRSVWEDLIRLVNDGKNDETARYKLVVLRKPECDLIPDNTGIAVEISKSANTNTGITTSSIASKINTIKTIKTINSANLANTANSEPPTVLNGNKNRSNKSNRSNGGNIKEKIKGADIMASTSNVVKFTVSQPPENIPLKAKLAWLSLTRTGNQFVHTDDGHWLFFNGDLNKSVIFCNDEKLIEWLEGIANRSMAENKIAFLQQFCPAVPELINEAVAAEMEKEVNGISGISGINGINGTNGTNGTNGIK